MKALEIKERRKEFGLTQSELAEKLGVSTKTVSNYESGGVIPESKQALLRAILCNNYTDEHHKSNVKDSFLSTGYDGKIYQLIERIYEHEEICRLLKDDLEGINHQKELIRLLKIQINLIEKAKKDTLNDQE